MASIESGRRSAARVFMEPLVVGKHGSVSSSASTATDSTSAASSKSSSASSSATGSVTTKTVEWASLPESSAAAAAAEVPYFVRRRARVSADDESARHAARAATGVDLDDDGGGDDDGASLTSSDDTTTDQPVTDDEDRLRQRQHGRGRRIAVVDASVARRTVLIPQTDRHLRANELLHAGRVAEAGDRGLLRSPVMSNDVAMARLSLASDVWDGVRQTDELVLKLETLRDGSSDRSSVIGGSLRVLVEHLADEATPDSHYIDCFLLTYRHIASAEELMGELAARFNVVPPPAASAAELAYYAQWAPAIQLRTLRVIKKWLDTYPDDVRTSAGAQLALYQLLHQPEVASVDVHTLVLRVRASVRHVIERPVEAAASGPAAEEQAPTAPATDTPEGTKKRGNSNDASNAARLDMSTVDPIEMAQQLTLLDHELFAAIPSVEIVRRIWTTSSEPTSHVAAFVDWFNHLSFFVATEICKQPDAKKRAKLIETFVLTAAECRKLRNLNAAMAIVAGLNNSAVRRLKRTWALISPKVNDHLYELDMLLSDDGNFARYRELVSEIEHLPRLVPFIPFLGLLLHDLTFINDGNPSLICPGVFNFSKLRRIAEPVLFLRTVAQIKYSFPESRSAAALRAALQNSHAIADQDTLYQCSLVCEPRAT